MTRTEWPDFDAIAHVIAAAQPRDGEFAGPEDEARVHAVVVEQLRQVWNARGAADLAKVEAAEQVTPDGPILMVKTLKRSLRNLDR